MKVLVTGATGLIGRALVKELIFNNHQIVILTRDKKKALSFWPDSGVSIFEWDALKNLPPQSSLDQVDGVVHLMGENIANKRWSKLQRKKILESRTICTQNLMKGIQKYRKDHPPVFIQASAIGIYQRALKSKASKRVKDARRFLYDVCTQWEKCSEVHDLNQRRVVFRLGVVLSGEGGILAKLIPIFKLGLGGAIGGGHGVMNWIHIQDVTHLIQEALIRSEFQGVFNAVSSQPVTNKKFAQTLAQILNRPAVCAIPSFAIRLIYGSMSVIILDSLDVKPERLEKMDFKLKFTDIDQALKQAIIRE